MAQVVHVGHQRRGLGRQTVGLVAQHAGVGARGLGDEPKREAQPLRRAAVLEAPAPSGDVTAGVVV